MLATLPVLTGANFAFSQTEIRFWSILMYRLTHESASQLASPGREPVLAASDLRRSALWLGLGGTLFVLTYALELVFGMRYGREHATSDAATLPLAWGILFNFTLSLLMIALGLFRLALTLRPATLRVAIGGMLLAGVAFVLLPINLGFLLGAFGPPQHRPELMIPVLTNLAATTLLSVVVLRRRLVPRSIGVMLLIAGVITFPFILLTIPLEAVLPPFVIADMPFAAWGAALVAVSWMLWRYATR
jgi:hypothetical protein